MAHRTERQRAWHSLHRQLGRIPESEEVDREIERRRTIGELSGNNVRNSPTIPTGQSAARGTIRGASGGTVEGTTGERRGNNAAVPSSRTTSGSLEEEEGDSDLGEYEDGYKTGVIDAANHSLDEIRRLAARFRAERGE